MDARRRLASLVLESGWTVAEAARESGVSRQTAHEWVGRARQEGLAAMAEKSRRPTRIARSSPASVTQEVMAIAEQYPSWGPHILYKLLWPDGAAPVSERTVARILARAGRRVVPAGGPKAAATIRFERSEANELWQADFKRLGPRRNRQDSMAVIDDAFRYCLALVHVPDQTLESAWSVLWDVFGEYGCPLQFLCDNGSAFRNNATWRWSLFDLRLMLLGIRSAHGRPYHPQTQGKVERFNGTIEREIHFENALCIQKELDAFRDRYNWIRPHQALDMRTPGSLYQPSGRKRPTRMPEPFFPEGAFIRKTNEGVISFKGHRYKLGRAFTNLPVGLLEDEHGTLNLVWGNFILAPLNDFRV